MGVKNVNEVLLIGYVGRDAEMRALSTGTKVANFTMATSRGWKKGDSWENETTWHNITMWGRDAENSAEITKGKAVMVRGRISIEKWTDNAGIEKQTTKIVAYSVNVLVNFNSESGSYQGRSPAGPSAPAVDKSREVATMDDFDDDLPF